MLLAVVGHQDDVAVGRPDEPGQSQGIVGTRGGWLHRGHLVGLDAAQLWGRVEHPDAPQQGSVHLQVGTGELRVSERTTSRPATVYQDPLGGSVNLTAVLLCAQNWSTGELQAVMPSSM